MNGRLRWWLVGGGLVLAAVVAAGGLISLRARAEQQALLTWVPQPDDHQPWAAALDGGDADQRVSRPTPDTVQVEFTRDAPDAGFYAAAIRERDDRVAALTFGTWVAGRRAALAEAGAALDERSLDAGDEALVLRSNGAWAVLARRGRRILVISGSGIAQAPDGALASILERRWAAIADAAD